MRSNNNLKNKENGQSMVELALTLTILMVLLAGTIDLGRAFFTWLMMRDAAQEGATYASIDPTPADDADIIARISDNITEITNISGSVVVIDVDFSGSRCLDNINPTTITVLVDYQNFPITMPFLGNLIGNTIPIRATINDTVLSPLCN